MHQQGRVIIPETHSGIGRAISTSLARDGFADTVNYAGNATQTQEVLAEIKAPRRVSPSNVG
jgi:NAD(P)-dependent dehydrogenase (short-subunit alcohol dehydrogenase family)